MKYVALTFERLKYDLSESSFNILLDNSCDPDLHFFNTNTQNLNTPYMLPKEFQNFLEDDISVINFASKHKDHKKNSEIFKNFLSNVNYNFSLICFSET